MQVKGKTPKVLTAVDSNGSRRVTLARGANRKVPSQGPYGLMGVKNVGIRFG